MGQLVRTGILLLPLAALLGALLYHANLGIDITDEGYYLGNAAWAGQGLLAVSNFGHYTGLLYHLVGGDIGWFRGLGMVLLVAASAYFVQSIHGYWLKVAALPLGRNRATLNYSVFGALVLTYYFWWLPSPSYNWLALLCCLLTGWSGIATEGCYG